MPVAVAALPADGLLGRTSSPAITNAIGLIAEADYLELLGRSITSLLRTPGRTKQTLEEASFDAWIKYYRQDENSPNAQVSYYLKGSLVALCLRPLWST